MVENGQLKMVSMQKACFDNFEPRKRFTLLSADSKAPNYDDGVIFNSKQIFGESI